jgi:hypothetical protein
MTTEASAPAATENGPIVARAGQYYRITRYIMTFVLFLYGGWSIYDGFYSWPRWPISHPNEKPKSDTDIMFNEVLGLALPPIGLALLIRSLYLSRGEYRLEDDVLYVPGHPPVPLDKIQKIDRELWDRKGIAFIDYQVVGAKAGTITLDDFLYDRPPTDEIFKKIEAVVVAAGDQRMADAAKPAPVAPARPAALNPQPKSAVNVAPAKQVVQAKPIAPPKPVAPPRPVAQANPTTQTKPVVPQKSVPAARPATMPPRPAGVVTPRPPTAAPPGAAPSRPPAAAPPAAKPVSGGPVAPKPVGNPTAKPAPKPPSNQLPPRPRLGE